MHPAGLAGSGNRGRAPFWILQPVPSRSLGKSQGAPEHAVLCRGHQGTSGLWDARSRLRPCPDGDLTDR